MKHPCSRIQGFYRLDLAGRVDAICAAVEADQELRAFLERGGGIDLGDADRMSENVIATFGLPLGLGLNFTVNGRDVIVPMAIEEPSVVAAASNAARMVRESGGFKGEATASVMTAQVQFDGVPQAHTARERVLSQRQPLLEHADRAIARLVARGGGCRDLDVRVLDERDGVVVIDVHVDVLDAMGANVVDTVAEALGPMLHELLGGSLGLRILTNLPLRRMVKVWADVSSEALGGDEVADGIARASRFADLDVFRAVTHNKGLLNGLDAAALALGQDFRSIEAAAHAYASLSGRYRPLSTFRRTARGLTATCELPLAVGTVGGSTTANAAVRAAFRIVGVTRARELAIVLASVGLASNLAALRALSTEGIQRGHMKLHQRKHEAALEAKAP